MNIRKRAKQEQSRSLPFQCGEDEAHVFKPGFLLASTFILSQGCILRFLWFGNFIIQIMAFAFRGKRNDPRSNMTIFQSLTRYIYNIYIYTYIYIYIYIYIDYIDILYQISILFNFSHWGESAGQSSTSA